jgi:hypothetical protein
MITKRKETSRSKKCVSNKYIENKKSVFYTKKSHDLKGISKGKILVKDMSLHGTYNRWNGL